ncbi:F-box/LRR-repeat protein 12-like [Rutidosis leptorrhynchoides]|uniref:F-box/LRR-repeat protein 12-like n=1 Tax=Rutidosis leptorrhynchoides TaxID=125765 RepID=UPI003A999CBE
MDVRDKKQRLCITQLPDDLLSLIYRKLNEKRDQVCFRLTADHFLDIAIISCKCLDVTSSTRLSKSYNLDSIVLGRFLDRFRHLDSPSSISVLNLLYFGITDNGLETLTRYCNKSLISVTLTSCYHITNTGISFLKQNCPQLRSLKIDCCKNVVGVTSQQGFSSTLTYLQADAHALYPTGFLSGGGLEYLVVVFHHIEKKIQKYKNEIELGLAAIGSGIAKNLKILHFDYYSYVTDDCIIKVSMGCPFLQELKLVDCTGLGLPGWVSIGLHCQNLETLHVNSVENLCDRGLLALGHCCKLSVLYMYYCPQITSVGIHEFKTQRPDVNIIRTIGTPCFPKWTQY